MKPHFLLPDAPFASYAHYLAAAGGNAVTKARGTDPEKVLAAVVRSGLRGRGGAGFPTGVKWTTVRRHPCAIRSVVCNAAEGEPGTFKDRWLLRRNPYAVVEGLLIAAHVINTRDIRIGIHASSEKEVARLRAALFEMKQGGVLGNCTVDIFEGPDEYLFGEEKALLNAIDGDEPMPREAHYPPYEWGLRPTQASPNPALVNNAETFAHVPSIVLRGAESFRELGTHDTPGTLIFTLSGDVRRPTIVEREAGVTVLSLIENDAGGVRSGEVKAVLSGTASGVLTAEKLETPCDFGSLALAGSGLGSAGFLVYDSSRFMPRVAQALARFLYVESCDQCSACKHGLRTASLALDEIFNPAEVSHDDLERALYGARSAPQANRCYLPVQGSILIPSLVSKFREEFESRIAHPTAQHEKVPVPLIVDYDENAHAFTYVDGYERKQPDWTWLPAEGEVPPAPARAPEVTGPIGVRLKADLAKQLAERAHLEGTNLDRLVDRWLREKL